MQGAAREGSEAPGLEAAREREAVEAAEAAIRQCLAVGTCGEDPPQLFLESGKKVEDLLKALDIADGSQDTVSEALGEFIGFDVGFGVLSFGIDEWVLFFDEDLESCLTNIGPASLHGACLIDMETVRWEGDLIEGLSFTHAVFESYDGLYKIYPCHKQQGTSVKNMLVCPAEKSWYVFPNR